MILRMDLTDLDSYQIYNSIRLHFTRTGYDFSKYGSNKRTFSLEAFQHAPARGAYMTAAQKFLYKGRFIPFCAVTQFNAPGTFITHALNDIHYNRALKFRGYLAAFWTQFESDLERIYPFDKYRYGWEPFISLNSPIIDGIRRETLSPITGVMLAKIAPMLNTKCCFEENLIQSDMLQRLRKLTTFVPRVDDYNLGVGAEILRRVWNERTLKVN